MLPRRVHVPGVAALPLAPQADDCGCRERDAGGGGGHGDRVVRGRLLVAHEQHARKGDDRGEPVNDDRQPVSSGAVGRLVGACARVRRRQRCAPQALLLLDAALKTRDQSWSQEWDPHWQRPSWWGASADLGPQLPKRGRR